MKQADDVLTMELTLPRRGRPVTGLALSAAERKKRSRERKGVKALAVDLPLDILAGIEEYRLGKDLTQAQVIEKLLRSQLLRKR